ncbi:MAG: hypothetical protein ABH814_03220 [bacterium]
MSHKNLTLNHWKKYNFLQQMANIGSEVARSIAWQDRDKKLSQEAFERSLELFDITAKTGLGFPRLKELRRAREAWCDFVAGDNTYASTAKQWEDYFYQFNYAANIHK